MDQLYRQLNAKLTEALIIQAQIAQATARRALGQTATALDQAERAQVLLDRVLSQNEQLVTILEHLQELEHD